MSELSFDICRIYIFSYNRGLFLENCLQSIEKCASNFDVVVIDDQSDDKNTISVLKKYSNKFKVVTAGESKGFDNKTGGLNSNMKLALNNALSENIKFVLFIQDDMQLVRPILNTDLVNIANYFKNNSRSAELHTCFTKRQFAYKEEKYTYIDNSDTAYIRTSKYEGNSGFSAVGVFHVKRFLLLFSDIDIEQGERVKNKYAIDNNIYMGIYQYPFMMWLPYPISFRKKKRKIFLRLIEFIGGCGYYPYSIMCKSKIKKLINRDTEIRPYAEDWLSALALTDVRVWSFTGGVPNLIARDGVRARIGGLIYKAKNIFLFIKRML